MAERTRACEDIGEHVVRPVDRKRTAGTRRDRHIEVPRIGGNSFHGAGLSPEVPHDDPDGCSIIVDYLWNVVRPDILVAGLSHLHGARQVGPELEPVHPAVPIPLRHLLMQDPTASRHPLDIAGSEAAAVAETIAMLDTPRQYIGDRLDAPMRVPWKAGLIVLGGLAPKVIEEEKGIEIIGESYRVSRRPNSLNQATSACS